MTNDSFTTKFTVEQSPQEVFNAIVDPRRWWSEAIEGDTDRTGSVFFYRYRDLHRSTIKSTELVPGRKVTWQVLHNEFSFVEDKAEWTGTKLQFEIAKSAEGTELRFTHVGLMPECECFEVCSEGWHTYINGSLRQLISTGKGRPNVGEAVTQGERELSQ